MPNRPPSHRPAQPAGVTQHRPQGKARLSAHKRGYNRRWQQLRLIVLAKRPLCECGPDCCPDGCNQGADPGRSQAAGHWPRRPDFLR